MSIGWLKKINNNSYSKVPILSKENIIIAFFVFHIFVDYNREYLVAIFLLFLALYMISKQVLPSLWFVFLATPPFGMGKSYNFVVLPKETWGGGGYWDLGFNIPINFSDVVLVFIVYLLISRKINYFSRVEMNSFWFW